MTTPARHWHSGPLVHAYATTRNATGAGFELRAHPCVPLVLPTRGRSCHGLLQLWGRSGGSSPATRLGQRCSASLWHCESAHTTANTKGGFQDLSVDLSRDSNPRHCRLQMADRTCATRLWLPWKGRVASGYKAFFGVFWLACRAKILASVVRMQWALLPPAWPSCTAPQLSWTHRTTCELVERLQAQLSEQASP